MDPITSLGVEAASVQLAGAAARALLGTVKLLRHFRDAPPKVKQLLDDVERSVTRVAAILEPGGMLAQLLKPEHFARLAPCVLRTRHGLEDLQNAVKPLVPGQDDLGKSLPRLWKAAVSLAKEKDIQGKAERVRDLNLELVCELEVVGLNLHFAQGHVLPFLSIPTQGFPNGLTPTTQNARYLLSWDESGEH